MKVTSKYVILINLDSPAQFFVHFFLVNIHPEKCEILSIENMYIFFTMQVFTASISL